MACVANSIQYGKHYTSITPQLNNACQLKKLHDLVVCIGWSVNEFVVVVICLA